ncbi:MAG: glycosyltransferase family 39 protein [Promethearchaeota archaeon]
MSVILLLGLFLRFYDLGSESVWFDESVSIIIANSDWIEILKTATNDQHPPLYYFILQFWVSLFGNSEFSARLPSAIFGFLSLLVMFKVGYLFFDKEVGILSSLILGLSVFHIHYSHSHNSDNNGLIESTLKKNRRLSFHKIYIHFKYYTRQKIPGIEVFLFEK